MVKKKDHGRQTKLVHSGARRSPYGETSEAIYLTQGFVYDSAEAAEARFAGSAPDEYVYARYGSPTVSIFEDRIAAYEGAEDAFATASGMAAVNAAIMASVEAGDHLVSARALFGSCLYIVETLLPSLGVETSLVDGTDLDAWRAAIRPDTKAVFLEAISNPTLEVADIKAICALAHQVGARVIVDNVFATPVLQDSLALGADVLVYSATKHIDGQGRVLGGVVLGDAEFIRGPLQTYLRHTGGGMNPFTAWVLLKGLETMELRCERQADNALTIARALEGHEALAKVIYPGLESHADHQLAMQQMRKGGTMISFELVGGKQAAFRMMNRLEVILISNNLGDAKSLITHPATTTHQRLSEAQRDELGITPGLVRLSVGIEDSADLVNDLLQALA